MPELPDVEVFRRYVNSTSLHQNIELVEVRNGKILGGVSALKLQSTLKGRRFESTRRHGKNLFVGLDGGGWLLMHFGMTGRLKYFKEMDQDPPHDRLLISFENQYHLAFDCQRMLGNVDLIEDLNEFIREKQLGPDLLELDYVSFQRCFEGRKGTLKSALMNQQVVAGVGNIYSDEILFQAGVHPGTEVKRNDDATFEKLFQETRRVLKTAIERGANPQM